MIDIEQTRFREDPAPGGTVVQCKLSWIGEGMIFKEDKKDPRVVDEMKLRLKHKIWDKTYGEIVDPVLALELMIRRDMMPSALPQAMEKIAELKKLLAYPK